METTNKKQTSNTTKAKQLIYGTENIQVFRNYTRISDLKILGLDTEKATKLETQNRITQLINIGLKTENPNSEQIKMFGIKQEQAQTDDTSLKISDDDLKLICEKATAKYGNKAQEELLKMKVSNKPIFTAEQLNKHFKTETAKKEVSITDILKAL